MSMGDHNSAPWLTAPGRLPEDWMKRLPEFPANRRVTGALLPVPCCLIWKISLQVSLEKQVLSSSDRGASGEIRTV